MNKLITVAFNKDNSKVVTFHLNIIAGDNAICFNDASNRPILRFDGEEVDKYDISMMAKRCREENGQYLVWSKSNVQRRYCSKHKPPMNIAKYGVCTSGMYHPR